jgi:hypothetical protein
MAAKEKLVEALAKQERDEEKDRLVEKRIVEALAAQREELEAAARAKWVVERERLETEARKEREIVEAKSRLERAKLEEARSELLDLIEHIEGEKEQALLDQRASLEQEKQTALQEMEVELNDLRQSFELRLSEGGVSTEGMYESPSHRRVRSATVASRHVPSPEDFVLRESECAPSPVSNTC